MVSAIFVLSLSKIAFSRPFIIIANEIKIIYKF